MSELENLKMLFDAIMSGEVISLQEALKSHGAGPLGRLWRASFKLAVATGEIESVKFKGTVFVKRSTVEG